MIDQLSVASDRPVPAAREAVLRAVEEAIAGLDYGSIVLTVHGARVVQLDVTRRQRFSD
ncbi:MAG: YezD family protein [Sphingomonas phyllosphaerae]